MKKIIKYPIAVFSLFSLSYVAQNNTYTYLEGKGFIIKSSISATQDLLNDKITAMFTDPVMQNANWGFALYDPKNKKILSSYNENTSLIPASTTKLLTTETALSIFGKDFQWTTQLEYSGNIDESGILNGNIYIVGSGDPSLGTGRAGANSYTTLIDNFKNAIKNLGIRRIKGDIVLKTAVFKNNKNHILPMNIVWKNDTDYYLPAGNIDNTQPIQEKTKNKQDKFAYTSPHTNKIIYTNNFNGKELYSKLPDATYYLANNLKLSLAKNGVITEGKVVNKTAPQDSYEERKKIATYLSPKLEELVYFTNQTSNNAMSEFLLKTIGFYKKGDFSKDMGRSAVNNHLEQRAFDFQGFHYADGSGLSRSNIVTPISQVKFLSEIIDEKHFDIYLKSLPIGGQTGTLKSMFHNTDSYGRVFAKTGTLNKVKTLAGYIKTKNGKLLVFSLLINNYRGSVSQVKQRMETILAPIVEF